jgi:hypothetical protein
MKVQTVGEIAREELKLPPWLFEGFLRHRTLTILGAERHSGKTLLMLNMMICLEAGLPLLGRFPVPVPRRTLFIGQDAPEWDYKGIVQKLMRGHGIDTNVGALFDSGMVLNENVQLTDPRSYDPKNGSWLSEHWNEHPFDVLMLDTEIEMHRLNENESQAMAMWGRIKKSIRDRFGCSVISSHHLAHPTDPAIPRRLRGSTTLGGTVDYEIILSAIDPREANPRNVKLKCDKARGGTDVWPEFFRIYQEPSSIMLTVPASVEPWAKKIDPGKPEGPSRAK